MIRQYYYSHTPVEEPTVTAGVTASAQPVPQWLSKGGSGKGMAAYPSISSDEESGDSDNDCSYDALGELDSRNGPTAVSTAENQVKSNQGKPHSVPGSSNGPTAVSPAENQAKSSHAKSRSLLESSARQVPISSGGRCFAGSDILRIRRNVKLGFGTYHTHTCTRLDSFIIIFLQVYICDAYIHIRTDMHTYMHMF